MFSGATYIVQAVMNMTTVLCELTADVTEGIKCVVQDNLARTTTPSDSVTSSIAN